MDISSLNTRRGYGASAQTSMAGWYGETKPAYRTYGLQEMDGYYYYANNLSGGGWNAWNCTGYRTYAGPTYIGYNAANCQGNCNCNCSYNCGTTYREQCANCSACASGENCTSFYSGIQCAVYGVPGQCGQCTIAPNCDTQNWMQPNCNCAQCNCACDCQCAGECVFIDNNNCWTANCECAAGTCFLPDTLVIMRDGSLRRIADIEVGEETLGGTVIGLYRPLIGDRSLWTINGIETTGDHLFRTDRGWTALFPSRYDDMRRGRTTEDGFALGHVEDVASVFEATDLALFDGLFEPIDHAGITDRLMPPETQLYTLVTDSGLFVLKGGYVVDGMPQPGEKK